jgi:hypothetical protein
VPQYQCQVQHTAGTCPAPANVNENRILPYVERAFFDYVGEVAAHSRAESVELTAALSAEAEAEAALTAYRDDTGLQLLLGMESWKAGLRTRQTAAQRASAAAEHARQAASGVDLPATERLTEMWPQLNPSE